MECEAADSVTLCGFPCDVPGRLRFPGFGFRDVWEGFAGYGRVLGMFQLMDPFLCRALEILRK